MNDIDTIRADTPACRDILHFNNARASLMPMPVYESVLQHLKLENEIGGYEAQHQATSELEAFYTEFATLLNASNDEIAFVENATRAWDMAFYGLPWIENRVAQLGASLRRELTQCPEVNVHDLGLNKCGIVTFTKAGLDASAIAKTPLEKGINISVSTMPHARLDLGRRKLESLARASVHYFNTENEIDRFVDTVKSL